MTEKDTKLPFLQDIHRPPKKPKPRETFGLVPNVWSDRLKMFWTKAEARTMFGKLGVKSPSQRREEDERRKQYDM